MQNSFNYFKKLFLSLLLLPLLGRAPMCVLNLPIGHPALFITRYETAFDMYVLPLDSNP